MDRRKLKALKADGWKIGTVQELLDLSDEEMAFIEMKVALAKAMKETRAKRKLSQTQLAARMGSSQARVAKMEKGEATLDLLVRGLLAGGASPREIGGRISGSKSDVVTAGRASGSGKKSRRSGKRSAA